MKAFFIGSLLLVCSLGSIAKTPNYFRWLWYYHKQEDVSKLRNLLSTLNDTIQSKDLPLADRIDINVYIGKFYHYIGRNGIANPYLLTAKEFEDSILNHSPSDKDLLEKLIIAHEMYLEVQLAMGNQRFLQKDIEKAGTLRRLRYNKQQLNYYKGDLYKGIFLYHRKEFDSAKFVLLELHDRIRFSHEIFDQGVKTFFKVNYYLARIYQMEDKVVKWRYHLGLAIGNYASGVHSNNQLASDLYLADLHYQVGDLYLRLNDQKGIEKKVLPNIKIVLGEDWINKNREGTVQVKVPSLVTRAKIRTLAGDFQNTLEDFSEASGYLMNFIGKGFNSLSESEREFFYTRNKEYFDEMNSYLAYMVLKNPVLRSEVSGLLFNNQLNTKAFLLEEQSRLQHKIANSDDTEVKVLFSLYQQTKQARAQSYFESASTDSLDYAILQLEKQLSSKFPDFSERETYSWKDVRGKLKEGEVAVEIVRVEIYEWVKKTEKNNKGRTSTFDFLAKTGGVIYFALIVDRYTKDYPKLVLMNNGSDLEGKYLPYFRNNILHRSKDLDSYNNYWGKLGEYLNAYEKIYFSADGVYNQISLSALLNPATSRYLTEEQSIVHISSTRDLLSERKQTSHATGVYLFGNPSFSPQATGKQEVELESLRSVSSLRENNHEPLPGTELEIDAITSILSSNGLKVSSFLQTDASEEKIRNLKRPGILHIATHGYFFEGTVDHEPPLLNSGLLFSGVSDASQNEQGLDGILTAYEASLLDLNGTNLVVLSACETGLGRIRNGEGVYGLQRALQIAGAKNVMVSLWKVDDNATRQLMEYFYENVADSMPYRTALSNAQRIMKEQYDEPYYWAAFRLLETEK